MRSFGAQQREHRLVATVNAVEVADRQCTCRRDAGMVEAAKDLHARDYGRLDRLPEAPSAATERLYQTLRLG